MSIMTQRFKAVPASQQCGHELRACVCGHDGFHHRYGTCELCDCARFMAARCSRSSRCPHHTERLELTAQVTSEYLTRWKAQDDAERQIDPTRCGIYFIRCQQFIKIGKTTNVDRRLAAHQMSTPFDLEVIGFIPCVSADLDQMEGAHHRRFKRFHHRGEWFRAAPTLLEFIAQLPKVVRS